MKFKIPGQVKGKARPRLGRGHTYTPKDTVEYENWVRSCFYEQCHNSTYKIKEGFLKCQIIM